MNNIDDFYMGEALKEARKAFDNDEIPVGAVICCGDKIIARAHNSSECLHDVTAHAEMIAITAATNTIGGKYLNDCTLYVTLEPCIMCAGALAWAQIGHIVYGASDPKHGFTTIQQNILHPKTTVKSGIMSNEAAQLLKLFFESKRV